MRSPSFIAWPSLLSAPLPNLGSFAAVQIDPKYIWIGGWRRSSLCPEVTGLICPPFSIFDAHITHTIRQHFPIAVPRCRAHRATGDSPEAQQAPNSAPAERERERAVLAGSGQRAEARGQRVTAPPPPPPPPPPGSTHESCLPPPGPLAEKTLRLRSGTNCLPVVPSPPPPPPP